MIGFRELKSNIPLMKYSVYGNCQADCIGRMISKMSEEAVYVPLKSVMELDHSGIDFITKEILPKLDVFIYIIVSNRYKGKEYSSDYLASFCNSKCKIIAVTPLFFHAYFPTCIHLHDDNGHYIHEPCDYHDSNIIREYLGLSKLTNHDCENIARNDLTELKRRERLENVKGRAITVPMSYIIKKHYKTVKLFHTINHPTGVLICLCCNWILDTLKKTYTLPEQYLLDEMLNTYQFPIDCSFSFHNSNSCYIFNGRVVSEPRVIYKDVYEKLDTRLLVKEVFSPKSISAAISLGNVCCSSAILKYLGWKKSSTPFDWIRTNTETVIDCLKTDFSHLLNQELYCNNSTDPCNDQMAGHTLYGHDMFLHRNPRNIIDYNYLQRCVFRFRNLDRTTRTLFLLTSLQRKPYRLLVDMLYSYGFSHFTLLVIEPLLSNENSFYKIRSITDDLIILNFYSPHKFDGIGYSLDEDNAALRNCVLDFFKLE